MAAIPPRNATNEALTRRDGTTRELDVSFDIDLGQLAPDRRVIARGLELSETGAQLHYEFVPGMTPDAGRGFSWYWSVAASDDAGTTYDESNSGAFSERGGAASHGVRDLGGIVPPEATRLTLRFSPAPRWEPRGDWRREVVVDLVHRTVIEDGAGGPSTHTR